MSSTVNKQTRHSRWTEELAEQIPNVEGARIEIINGKLYVTSTLPNWTTDIVEQMPHIEGERYEIIAGELFVTSQPHIRHQITCDNIIFELNSWGLHEKLGRALQAPGVVYHFDDAVAPDVVWISQGRFGALFGSDGKLHESPELAVEVLSRSTAARDRKEKMALYNRQGVQEYWIVDWRAATVESYGQVDGALTFVQTHTAGDTLTSPLFPGFACPIDQFFEI